MTTAIDNPLTAREMRDYEKNTVLVRDNIAAVFKVGAALKDIRDRRLYREDHGTFEAYCRDEWDIDRTYAHRLIESSGVVEVLPIGNKPATESQARPLTQLDDPEEQAEAWERAVETAPKDDDRKPKVTAKRNVLRQDRWF